MRVGILSDTHDQRSRTAAAVQLLIREGAEVLIHCGDLTGPEIVHACGDLPGFFVFGNNDWDEEGLKRAMEDVGSTCLGHSGEVVLDGKRIAVNHGDVDHEMRRIATRSPDYLLFGHSHRPTDQRNGATRWINPGALHRARSWTVALLDLETDILKFLAVDVK